MLFINSHTNTSIYFLLEIIKNSVYVKAYNNIGIQLCIAIFVTDLYGTHYNPFCLLWPVYRNTHTHPFSYWLKHTVNAYQVLLNEWLSAHPVDSVACLVWLQHWNMHIGTKLAQYLCSSIINVKWSLQQWYDNDAFRSLIICKVSQHELIWLGMHQHKVRNTFWLNTCIMSSCDNSSRSHSKNADIGTVQVYILQMIYISIWFLSTVLMFNWYLMTLVKIVICAKWNNFLTVSID